MENTDSKQLLIKYLSFVRDCELEKPINEIRIEIVDACIQLLLRLQAKEVNLTTEQIKEKVRKIPFVLSADFSDKTTNKTKKYTTKKKILLVAAVIALMVAMLSICSVADQWDIFDFVREIIGYENVVYDKEYTYDGSSFINNERIDTVEEVDDFYKENPYDILLPTYMPEGLHVDYIAVTDMVENTELNLVINDNTFGYIVYTNTKLSQDILNNYDETVTITDKTVYIDVLTDVGIYQMYFESKGDYYKISYTNKQELLKVIENLEE